MTRPWCPQSKRVLGGLIWDSHIRLRCPECHKRVTVVAGRVSAHRLPARARA